MSDEQSTVRLKDLLVAARELGALLGTSTAQLDEQGAPLPGTPTARLYMMMALYQPHHRARKPGRN